MNFKFAAPLIGLSLAAARVAVALPPPTTNPAYKTPPNWKAEILAAPPDVKWPSCVEQAPDGKIFVGEHAEDMPGPAGQPIDRILCIHPDGHVTVFADKLNAVFGLRYIDGKLFVHQSPVFTVFTDDNGVGKDPHNLIDSTYRRPEGNALNDHIPANFRLGMDNYLYMSIGDKGVFGAKSNSDGSTAQIHGGGVLRFRVDGKNMEAYSTGTRNHMDLAINPEDEIFTYDNTDDGQGWWTRYTHMVDGGWYGYPFDYKTPTKPETYGHNGEKRDPTKPFWPWTLWRIEEYGGGSPCGAVGYDEDALPDEYHGNNFHCEWGKGNFERFIVSRDGGSYKIDKRETMLSGPNFRPIAVSVLNDGSGFLICDWEMGGWANAKEMGHLFKLTYTGKLNPTPKPAWYLPAAMGKPFEATTADLIAGLSHPAESVRLVAQRRIAERGKEAVEPLVALLKDSSKPLWARWHAIWTLDLIDGGVAARKDIIAVAKDDAADVSVRRQAIRQLGTRGAKEAAPALIPLVNHADASMRFRAATALGRIGDPSALPALLAKLDEKDFFTHYADFVAIRRIGIANEAAWAAIVKGLASEKPEIRAGVQLAAHETYENSLIDALAAAVKDKSLPTEARVAALQSIAPLHRQQPAWDGKWWATQPAGSPPPGKTVEWTGTSVVLATIRDGLKDSSPAVRRAAIEAVEVAPDEKAAAELVAMFGKESDMTTKKDILKAIAASKSPTAISLITNVLKDPSHNGELVAPALNAAEQIGTPDAINAIVVLAESKPTPEQLTAAFDALARLKAGAALDAISKQLANPDTKVAIAAANALAQIGGPRASAALIPAIAEPRIEVRKAVITALGQTQSHDATPKLLEAYKDPQNKPEAIAALTHVPDVKALDAYIEGLGGQDGGLRDLCHKAIASISQPALPLIESKLESSSPPSAAAIGELQQIYSSFMPVMHWSLIGPFTKQAPEPFPVNVLPPTTELKGLDDKMVKWQQITAASPNGHVDLGKLINPQHEVSTWAVAQINSPTDRDCEFRSGSDDGISVFVNGAKLFEDLNNHGWNPDAYHFKGHLKRGTNLIVLRITNTDGGYEFSLEISGPKQGKLFTFDTSATAPPAYATFASSHPGDANAGSALFHNAQGVGCIKCHTVNGEGGTVGPNLSDIALKYPKEHLIEDVLYPSKQIESGYEQTLVRLKNGNVETGVVRAETDDDVTLFDSTARKIVIHKADIQTRKTSPVSVMPEGLQAGLTHQQFADVISYLLTLKQKPAGK